MEDRNTGAAHISSNSMTLLNSKCNTPFDFQESEARSRVSDDLVREALREGSRVIVRAEVTPVGTPRLGASRISTPRIGTPTPLGTGTPFSGTPTARRKNLAQCQMRVLPGEELELGKEEVTKVEMATYVELEPDQRNLSLFHMVKSLLGCTRVAQGKHTRESGRESTNDQPGSPTLYINLDSGAKGLGNQTRINFLEYLLSEILFQVLKLL